MLRVLNKLSASALKYFPSRNSQEVTQVDWQQKPADIGIWKVARKPRTGRDGTTNSYGGCDETGESRPPPETRFGGADRSKLGNQRPGTCSDD